MTMIEAVKMDIKERFATFETMRGLYRVPAGALILFTVWSHVQFAIQVYFTVQALAMIGDGARKIFANRIKQDIKKKTLMNERMLSNAEDSKLS